MARLRDQYQREIRPALMKELAVDNLLAVPRLKKIVVSVGIGRALADSRWLELVSTHLAAITGQHPVTTKARKSIAGFKLREGAPIGLKVTLRGSVMYEFLDRLIQVTLPRVRDFRGLEPDAFDPQGNYTIGLSEISPFPETSSVELTEVHGLQITLVTTAQDRASGEALIRAFGLPLRARPGVEVNEPAAALAGGGE